MDRKSIERLMKELQTRRADLQHRLEESQADMLRAKHDYGRDEGDRANTAISTDSDLRQKSRDRALLSAIDAALERIREGRFGECLRCAGEVSEKRLAAIPWVQYCITCEELIAANR